MTTYLGLYVIINIFCMIVVMVFTVHSYTGTGIFIFLILMRQPHDANGICDKLIGDMGLFVVRS